MYTISRWIYEILDIQFFAKKDIPDIYYTQFPVEFTQFYIFNLSSNPDCPYN